MNEAKQKAIEVSQEHIRKAYKKHEGLMVVITYNILFANKMACEMIYRIPEFLQEDSNLYQGLLKRKINILIKRVEAFEKQIYARYGELAEFFNESVQRMNEEMDWNFQMLFFTICAVLDRKKIENSNAISHVEQVRILLELAISVYKNRMKEVHELDKEFPTLDYMNMKIFSKQMGEISKMMNKNIKEDIDLNKYNDINNALQLIDRNLADPERIARAIKQQEEEE